MTANKKTGQSKLRAVLEFCLKHGSNLSPGVPKTKLLKLVYLADFSSFYYLGHPITGVQYVKRKYGPVPNDLFKLVDRMATEGSIKITPGNKADFHSLVEDSKTGASLSDKEIKILSKVCEFWRNKKTDEIVKFAHKQRPWLLTKMGAAVPYELILQEESPFRPIS